jgi:RNA polymerase sigma factor (sigma-70 family)
LRKSIDTGDVVQEIFLGTIRCLENIRPRYPGSFPTYLRRAVLNRINDETRKSARKPELAALGGNETDTAPSPLDQTIGLDLREQYERAMMRLTENDRAAVFLRVELKMGYAEIAGVLNKPSTDAARMAVQRALVRLAEGMHDENGSG